MYHAIKDLNVSCWAFIVFIASLWAVSAFAGEVIDPIANVTIPAGKSLIIPVTATATNGRPLTFTASSSTSGIVVVMHTNNPFWKMTVVQAASSTSPGAFQTPFRGGTQTVTNVGDMTFMLFPEYSPHTIDVFKGLTDSGFYNSNTIFHRVISGFIIQGGDPLTNGLGGPVFRYNDEWNPQAIFSGIGQLALANSGKDTDGSQFFVTVSPYRSGDFNYTIFGQLLRGFNVLSNINNTATDTNSRPLANVIITRTSFVPDTSDTALTLTATNLNGVTGTIQIVADDGAGGRTTNTFTATSLTDTNDNGQPFIYRNTMTNLVTRINLHLTNVLNATALNGEALYWFPLYQDQASINAVSNLTSSFTNSTLETLTYNVTNALGQLTLIVKPQTNYAGPVNLVMVVSANPNWLIYYQDFGYKFPYAVEDYTFAFGDTPISAQSTNFTALALTPFANQPLAWFTNGVPTSLLTNFTTYINWGDNVTNSGVIIKNANGSDEVLGSHMYTNAGTYPIYLTIQSYLGAASTVVSTASVPPSVSLTLSGTNNVITWPAWATEYQLQSTTNLSGSSWQATSNFPALNGYNSVVTNGVTNPALFYRLMK